jgi:hypothetical protein
MEKVNIIYDGPGIVQQDYSLQDDRLITSNYITAEFGDSSDYIEFFVYDQNGNLEFVNYQLEDYYPDSKNTINGNRYAALVLDPQKDLTSLGFNRGTLNTQYNFLRRLFNSSFGTFYWIKEISSSRTEIRLASQVLSNTLILNAFSQYQNYVSTKNYFPDFYLNFGNNELIIANNVAYSEDPDTGESTLLIKLYEPLPDAYDIKSELWMVDKVAESVSFNVDFQIEADVQITTNSLRGPNFKIAVNDKNGQTTEYYSYSNLLTSEISSSYQKMLSYYQDKSVDINVDYTNFGNFIHFSNATERVNNFVYKLELLESYSAQIAAQNDLYTNGTSINVVSSSIGIIENSVNNLIEKFDLYEYYLYFTSASWAWPKQTNTQPYQLYSVTSSEAANWLGSTETVPSQYTSSLLYSASFYDATNKDQLINSIPQYLLDDPSNAPYTTFLNMIGQHFDNIWLYYKDVTTRYESTNNPDTGISLDMVSDALKGLGFELYTNSNVSDNLYYTLFGINPDGTLLPPTGSEVINTYVTSSIDTIGNETLQGELYKRLYHNLPYLLKTRGTQRSVKALISTFGIPESILTVNEFGGEYWTGSVGIFEINNDKIDIMSGSIQDVHMIFGRMDMYQTPTELSASVLSPYATLQYYNTSKRINSTNVEVGFSPANTINANITGSLPSLNLNQLIGSPANAYTNYYPDLEAQKEAYFSSYNQPHSVWEYIRLIKYYNNVLFKTVRDFIPARANLSTGIIVKSHILERNKYARHEPSMSMDNNLSQSIDMIYVDGGIAGAISGSTINSGFHTSSLGIIPYTSTDGIELYNGEFGGTVITATTQNSIGDQTEVSSIQYNGIETTYTTYSLNYLYQNISASVRSQRFLDLDYTSDQLTPINLGLITQSINNALTDNYNTYTNPNNPYAQLQDTNYRLNSFTIPRYYGSKTISATYNDYTQGDESYGSTAAIDKIKFQYAYLVDMYSSSLQLPGRVNAQIKYIFNNDQNVLNLTKANENIFTIQNVFKSGENVDISLFDYDPSDQNIQFLTNNKNLTLFEGGFRYSPVLYNVAGNNNPAMTYIFKTPFEGTNTATNPATNIYTVPSSSNSINTFEASFGNFYNGVQNAYTASINKSGGGVLSQNLRFGLSRTVNSQGALNGLVDAVYFAEFNAGTALPIQISNFPNGILPGSNTFYNEPTLFDISAFSLGQATQINTPVYLNSVNESDHRWYAVDGRTVRLTATQSQYYSSFTYGPTASVAGLETPVFPFILENGDMVRFYNVSASNFGREDEFRVVSTYQELSGNTSYYYVTLDRNLSRNNVDSGSFPSFISRYIALKKIPDETNLILNYSSSGNIPQDGLVFPQYINPLVKRNSGNLVKALKQQNLI